jgi:hypothetical protein
MRCCFFATDDNHRQTLVDGVLHHVDILSIIQHMKARLVFEMKEEHPTGLVAQAVIWQMPQPTAERPHRIKPKNRSSSHRDHRGHRDEAGFACFSSAPDG